MESNALEKTEINTLSILNDNNDLVTTHEDDYENSQVQIDYEKETVQHGPTVADIEEKTEWDDSATKLLLDKFHSYLSEVGPMKKFKLKKQMWEKISADLLETLKIEKSPVQCENRYKTIMKRKKKAMTSNKKTGEPPKNVEYEEELQKIASLDDSVEPEVKAGIGRFEIKKQKYDNDETEDRNVENLDHKKLKKIKKDHKKDISEVLWDIHRDKEQKRENRHREKMEMLKEIGRYNM